MAWIELHQSVFGHRKTIEVADELGISEIYVVGHLAALWTWALDNAPSGTLRCSARVIAKAAQWTGDPAVFVKALSSPSNAITRYLDPQADGSYILRNWHRYAGKLIDRRKRNAEAMRIARGGDIEPTGDTRNSHVCTTCKTRECTCKPTVPNLTIQNPPIPPLCDSAGSDADAPVNSAGSVGPGDEDQALGDDTHLGDGAETDDDPEADGDPSGSGVAAPAVGEARGRRNARPDPDAPALALFVAFRRIRFPAKDPADIPRGEFAASLRLLREMVKGGATPADMERATQVALGWKGGYAVTIKAVNTNWTSLLEQADSAESLAASRAAHGTGDADGSAELPDLPPGVTLAKILNAASPLAAYPETGRIASGEGAGVRLRTFRPLAGRWCNDDHAYYPLAWEAGSGEPGVPWCVDDEGAAAKAAFAADRELMRRPDILTRIQAANAAAAEQAEREVRARR